VIRHRRGLFLCAVSCAVLGAAASASVYGHRAPIDKSLPKISGAARPGHLLRASPGRWAGAFRLTYRWKECDSRRTHCKVIGPYKHARKHGRTYRISKSDVGRTIRVTVFAANPWGRTSATSRATAVVKALTSPSRSGTPSGPGSGTKPIATPTLTPIPTPAGSEDLHVSGDRMVDGGGKVVQLHGVNRSGTEYTCIHGGGIFDGPSDAASVAAMASWHINIVRVPLNEDCWLGINGVKAAYSGQSYINAITNYVKLLHSYGIYAELSLMWGAPGAAPATYQANAPDEDHSPAMWASMAQTFKNDPNVILAPWGETTVDWPCWLSGCSDGAGYSSQYGPFDGLGSNGCGVGCDWYATAGMQQAVTVMRQNGYGGPISIPCIAFANVCADPSTGGTAYGNGNWLQDHPTDPDNQILAEMHIYGGNACATTSCLNLTVLPILQSGYPVIFGETGETYNNTDPGTSYISTFLTWAEQNGVGTEAWTWDTWGNYTTSSLISNYDGTPEDAYGSYVQNNYQTTFPPNR
jgi:endoglucanase